MTTPWHGMGGMPVTDQSIGNKTSKCLPVKDSGGDSVGVVLDPRGILEDITTGTVLLEILVGDLSCEDSLSKVLVHVEGRECSGRDSGLAARNGFNSGGGDEHGQRDTVSFRV
jgi:hypothetical protein